MYELIPIQPPRTKAYGVVFLFAIFGLASLFVIFKADGLQKENTQLIADLEAIQAQLSAQTGENDRLKEEVEKLTNEVSVLEDKVTDLREQAASLQQEKSAMETRLEQQEIAHQGALAEVVSLRGENQKLTVTVLQLEETNRLMSNQFEAWSEDFGSNHNQFKPSTIKFAGFSAEDVDPSSQLPGAFGETVKSLFGVQTTIPRFTLPWIKNIHEWKEMNIYLLSMIIALTFTIVSLVFWLFRRGKDKVTLHLPREQLRDFIRWQRQIHAEERRTDRKRTEKQTPYLVFSSQHLIDVMRNRN